MEFESSAQAVGEKVNYWDKIYTIAGVVKDYSQQSPKEAYEPHIFRFMPHGRDVRGFFMMKILSGNEKNVLTLVEQKYYEFFPDNPFDFFFLEDYYDQQYKDEKLLGDLFGIFALLSVIITCLGIFGLTSYLMIQKTKEISIRKVMGSDVSNIIRLFSKDFVYITVIAFILAVPVTYFWITGWLKTFELRLEISFWDFFLPYLLVQSLTLITIGFIVKKSASANPSVNLRTE